MKLKQSCLLLLSSILLSSHAIAQDIDSSNIAMSSGSTKSNVVTDTTPSDITDESNSGLQWNLSKIKFELHGFMTAGMSKSSTPVDYNQVGYGDINNSANFVTPTLAGIQLNTNFNNNFSLMTQVVVDGDTSTGENPYSPSINWLYIQYKLPVQYTNGSDVAVRLGRFQIPAYLNSQQIQIGYNFPYTYLPNEVYRILPMYSMNGVNILFSHELGDSNWTLSAEPFYGNSSWKYNAVYQNTPSAQGQGKSMTDVGTFTGDNLLGLNVSLQYSNSLTLHGSYLQTSVSSDSGLTDDLGRFVSVGANYFQNNIWLAGEFAKRDLTAPIASLTGYYLSGGYQFNKLLPYVSYARIKTDNIDQLNKMATNTKLGPEMNAEVLQDQESYTVGLDYYVNTNMVIKGSYSLIKPQGDKSFGLFDAKPTGNVSMVTISTSLVF